MAWPNTAKLCEAPQLTVLGTPSPASCEDVEHRVPREQVSSFGMICGRWNYICILYTRICSYKYANHLCSNPSLQMSVHISILCISIYLSLNHIYILYIIMGSMSEKFLETTWRTMPSCQAPAWLTSPLLWNHVPPWLCAVATLSPIFSASVVLVPWVFKMTCDSAEMELTWLRCGEERHGSEYDH